MSLRKACQAIKQEEDMEALIAEAFRRRHSETCRTQLSGWWLIGSGGENDSALHGFWADNLLNESAHLAPAFPD